MDQEYKLVENENFPEHTGIQLINGQFKGIVYIYGNVRFSKDKPPILKFDYEVMINPEKHKYKGSEEFDDIIGDILVGLIDEKYNDRENDTNESNNEYTISQEGNTFS
jgi:hypothetical protein